MICGWDGLLERVVRRRHDLAHLVCRLVGAVDDARARNSWSRDSSMLPPVPASDDIAAVGSFAAARYAIEYADAELADVVADAPGQLNRWIDAVNRGSRSIGDDWNPGPL